MKKNARLEMIVLGLFLTIIVLIGILVFGILPNTLQTSTYTVGSEKFPSEMNGFKIGFFSDLCINDADDLETLEETVEKINKSNYDVVLFGGDLFYDDVYEGEKVQSLLTSIQADYGKFAVLGEKDLLTNADTTNILTLSGFEVLKDQAVPIYYNGASIVLIGLESEVSVSTVLSDKYSSYYKLVLVHSPDVFDFSNREDGTNPIDLQLSGHSYGGYVYLPLIDITQKRSGATNYVHGKYSIGDSTILISNGICDEPDINIRLFCSPNILSVTLNSVEETKKETTQQTTTENQTESQPETQVETSVEAPVEAQSEQPAAQ